MNKTRPDYHEVVGTAYDVSSSPDTFDDLLKIAEAYFFGEAGRAKPATFFERFRPADPKLDKRMSYLSELLHDELGLSGIRKAKTFHAQIEINPGSFVVTGNKAAFHLMGIDFPCKLDDLPFDYETVKHLQRHLKLSRTEGDVSDQIFLTTIEEPDIRSCLALVQRPAEEGGSVRVSISYIEWSKELIARLKEAFGLTDSEGEVLKGFLEQKSQKDIAEFRGTSVETVKAQCKSILKKTNCARMTEVVQLSASIAYLLRDYDQPLSGPDLSVWKTPDCHMEVMTLKSGRRLAWYEYGDGATVILFVHGFIQGPFFTEALQRLIDESNLRFICPSRPGFGYTTQARSSAEFNKTVVDDALELLDDLDVRRVIILAHQGGVGHAFRIAHSLGKRVSHMLMVDAGVPIDEDRHLEHMNTLTRLAGMACKHAPSMMSMILNLGLPVYKKRGIEWFLRDYLKTSPADLAMLSDPEILTINARGCFHIVEQGADAWVRDGAAAMDDWEADFDRVSVPQVWLHAEQCPVMALEFVEEFVSRKLGQSVITIPDTGLNVLHHAPERIIEILMELK